MRGSFRELRAHIEALGLLGRVDALLFDLGVSSPQFDVGARRNCAQVFGANRWLWLLPVWGDGPDGDGVHWPMHPDPELCAGEVEEGHGDVSNAKLLAEADCDWDSD